MKEVLAVAVGGHSSVSPGGYMDKVSRVAVSGSLAEGELRTPREQ